MIARFMIVGAFGFAIQLAAVWVLTAVAHWPWLPATALAVELAIVHNFVWHERWTWRTRLTESSAFARVRRFLRFNAAAGLSSIGGNLVVVAILAVTLQVPAVFANAIAVGVVSLVNFVVSDRWVFRFRCALLALAVLVPLDAHAAPNAATLTAWKAYVANTEARLDRTHGPTAAEASDRALVANGVSIDVPGGTISHWRGSAFIPGITVDRLLHGLMHPGTPPPQEDVVSSHVIGRSGDTVRVAMRLVRHAIVTVTYDTEHEMTFRRWSPTLATARSVATRIEETDGDDHGFLWRLNSYWQYAQQDGGVAVTLESLTLSRDMPFLLRPIASPLVRRIARESMVRTLEALRRQYQGVAG